MMSYPAVLVPAGGTPVDHLSIPRRPTRNPPEMVFLGQKLTFDGGSFIGYPSRKGWTEKDVYEPGSSGKSREEIVGFFQIWFFWGLLEDTLRIRIHESNLVKENALGQQVISTRDLPGLVQRWHEREQYLSVKAQTKHAKRIDKNLWHMCNILSWWYLYGISPFDQSDLLYLVMFGEYLQTSYKTVYLKTSRFTDLTDVIYGTTPDWFDDHRRWPGIQLESLKTRMIADGWCPSDIMRTYSTLQSYGLFYASMLEAPNYKDPSCNTTMPASMASEDLNHAPATFGLHSDLPPSHSNCSDFSCSAHEIDLETYETRHIRADCTCTQIETNVSNLCQILDGGQVPVVYLNSGIHLVPAKSVDRYVAISHVWSDGLGNPHKNALPQCQLERIAFLVKNLYPRLNGKVAFWIDTLCCPVQPLTARKQAIHLMLQTYQDADKVLVLDAYICSKTITLLPSMEAFMIIHCSKWNRRLWTLQEQIVARKSLYFQFKDHWINISDVPMIDELPFLLNCNSSGDPTQLVMPSALAYGSSGVARAVFSDYAVLQYLPQGSSERLSLIWNMLPFRATSRLSDEAVCLAALLGIDTASILDTPANQRMEKLWSIMPSIPSGCIFWIGPKLTAKGFKWAPATFLNGKDLIKNRDTGIACLTEKGLQVQYPGWMLGCYRGKNLQAQFRMMDVSGRIYMVSCFDGTSRQYLPPDSHLDPWTSTSEGTLHVISQFDLDDAGDNETKLCYDAVLVLAYGVDQDELLVHYVCPVTVRKLETASKEAQTWKRRAEELLCNYDATIRQMGFWSSSYEQCAYSVIDFMGCSAIAGQQTWYID